MRWEYAIEFREKTISGEVIAIKRIQTLITMLLTLAIFFTPIRVLAADAWAIAAEALGIVAAYNSTLQSILKLGNNVNAQMSARRQDIAENGLDTNKRDVEVVDAVMNRLVNSATYELKVNSLPFVWTVNNSEKFNAACYPMNYITVNRGLVRGLNLDENQIAAVLAHEMTHGILQHSAKNYAKAIAQSMGAMMVGANVNNANINWNRMAGIVDYSIAKSINVPSEYEADEGGFYLMTSAGFNPGGGAAAMARMGYYMRYETRDFLEFDAHDKSSDETFSDHPDTERREEKMVQLMTDYSCGHVKVAKVNRSYDVLIDGVTIYTATNTGANTAADKAYYFAGGLARGFHDYKTVDGWNFRRGSGNSIDFLTDDIAYRHVRDIAFAENIGDRIRVAVVNAYRNENPNTRQKYVDAENARTAAWQKVKAETLSADVDAAKQLRINADVYNDYGQGELALKEIARALDAKNQDNIAECLAIRGRAKAVCGKYDDALVDVDSAVAQDPGNLYNYLNRADVRRMRGENDLALVDIDNALKIDSEVAVTYQLRGDIYDAMGDKVNAEESYRNCYILSKKNPRSIPLEYLEKIDAKAAAKIRGKESEKRD